MCVYPSSWKVFPCSRPGRSLSHSGHLVSRSSQPTGRLRLPLTSSAVLPLVVWDMERTRLHHQLSWESGGTKTNSFHQRLQAHPGLRLQCECSSLFALSQEGLFFFFFFLFYQHLAPIGHHPDLSSSHLLALAILCPTSPSCWLSKHNLFLLSAPSREP